MYTTTFISHGVTIHAVPEPDHTTHGVQVNTAHGVAWIVMEVQPDVQPRAVDAYGNLASRLHTQTISHATQIGLAWAIYAALTPVELKAYKHPLTEAEINSNQIRYNPKIHSASGRAVEKNGFANPIPLGRHYPSKGPLKGIGNYVKPTPPYPWPKDSRRVHHVEIGQKAGTVYWERNQWVVSRELTDGTRQFLMGSEWVYSPVWYPRSVAIRNLRTVIERNHLFAHGEV